MMTDEHRQFFVDLYHFYERHEHPPNYSQDEAFKAWWAALMEDGSALCRKYSADPAAASMIFGVIDGIQEAYKAAEKVNQQKGADPT